MYVGLGRLTDAHRFSCVGVGRIKIAALAEGVAKKKKAKPVTMHKGISHRPNGSRVRPGHEEVRRPAAGPPIDETADVFRVVQVVGDAGVEREDDEHHRRRPYPAQVSPCDQRPRDRQHQERDHGDEVAQRRRSSGREAVTGRWAGERDEHLQETLAWVESLSDQRMAIFPVLHAPIDGAPTRTRCWRLRVTTGLYPRERSGVP